MDAPFGTLKYLYVGSARFDEDHAFYRDVIGAPLVWTFQRFILQIVRPDALVHAYGSRSKDGE